VTTDPPKEGDVRRWVGQARGAVVAGAGLITAVLGVVFLVAPSLRPLPRDKIAASVGVPTVENGVNLLDWARRQYPGHPYSALRQLGQAYDAQRDGAVTGTVVYVRLQTDGFRYRSIQLRARVYDADIGRPAPDTYVGQLLPKFGKVRLEAPSRSTVTLMFLDDLSKLVGRYFVRVEAYDGTGILAFADSPVIQGEK
jgi:hypothetical protein